MSEETYVIDWTDVWRGMMFAAFMLTSMVNIVCITWYLKTPNQGVISCTADGVHVANVVAYPNGFVTDSQFKYNLGNLCGGKSI